MDPYVTTLGRFALAAVWSTAGVSKLVSRDDAGEAAEAFGLLPPRIARGVGRLLPYAELLLGVLLFLGFRSVFVAGAGAALLLAYTAAIVATLVRGRSVECHCFGQLSRGPVGWGSVVRNGLLLALSGVVAAFPSGFLAMEGPAVDLPVSDGLPLALLLVAAAIAVGVGRELAGMAVLAGRAEFGPAAGMKEWVWLRRRMGGSTPSSSGGG